MPLFQTSVLKKYLALQEQTAVEKAYRKYSKYFLNAEIQENIRTSKEEQFQATFLTELFVNVLDYTINPSPKYNLTTEYKNEKNNRKADGAILKDATTLAVVELKGTNTKDLESISRQAFDYKVNHKGCRYVITSNFEKLRFYIDDATDYEPFDLFQLTQDSFALLYLCLHKDNLLNALPLRIKLDSLVKEELITKEFYIDYSLFKRELFRDLVKRNSKKIRIARQQELEEITTDHAYQRELQNLDKNVKLALFKKSQKLIDRFLFIFFAEDRGLLTPNSTLQILEKWKADLDFGDERPLYSLFKQYFNYLDNGRKGTSSRTEIYAYNGGLFQPDSILDGLEIDDDLLYRHTLKLAKYDFESQVDVNILGHIFENSLNEIESVNAEIEGAEFDKQKSKRKKDGVYYTPKYITKYIVENTIGKLSNEKKAALGFKEEEYFKGRKHRQKATVQKLVEVLDEYRDWLLQITICDPACGSGAFLNQALDFLIKEHKYIDELKAKVLGGGLQFPDIENTILENNIYGVDLNEESVEIAKLSLWLRTAQPRRKLNDLSSNIKCGNSLIENKTVAGHKAFEWETAFPKVFKNGGFDVVIGNPPYVKRQNISDKIQISFLEKKYSSATYNFDLYLLFIEKAMSLVNMDGIVSYINPSKFTSTKTGEGLRSFIINNCNLESYVDFKDYQVFEDATTYCCIFTLKKGQYHSTNYKVVNLKSPKDFTSYESQDVVIQNSASGLGWRFEKTVDLNREKKVKDVVNTFTGIESGADNLYILSKEDPSFELFRDFTGTIVHPIIKGANVFPYFFEKNEYYGLVPYDQENKLISENEFRNKYSKLWDYLVSHKSSLEGREKGKMKTKNWYGYVYPKNLNKYENDRLIWTDISIKPQFALENTKSWHVRTVCSLELNKKGKELQVDLHTLLAIFNSNLFYYFIQTNSNTVRGGYFRYKPQYVKEFPLPKLNEKSETSQLSEECKNMINLSDLLNSLIEKFRRLIHHSSGNHKISSKLKNWYDLDFAEFINELNKAIKITNKQREKEGLEAIKEITKTDEFEWLDLFEHNKIKVQELQAKINVIQHQIDTMVYKLYGLNEEEIKIIENI